MTRRSKAARQGGIDRRTFVMGAAAGAAPLVLGCTTASTHAAFTAPAIIAPPERPVPTDVLKVGLIGCGGRGTGAAMNALRAEKGTVVLHAMADVLQDRVDSSLRSMREELKGEADALLKVTPERTWLGFDAYKKLVDSDVDVVILTTPPVFRPAMLAYAVEKKKHVFCEKPVAVDAPGIRSVLQSVARAKELGLSLVSGLCWRYDNRQRECFGRIVDGQIGEVQTAYTTYHTGPNAYVARKPEMSDMEHALRNWYHVVWLGGDHVVEQAVHSLDKMAWCFADAPPKSCVASGGRSTPVTVGDRWDHFTATFDYGDGRKGFHSCRQWANCASENLDWAWGTDGRATICGWSPAKQVIEGKHPWSCTSEQNDMYQAEHDELFASIRAGKAQNDGVRMTHSTMLAIMTRMAAYTGQVITWEQAMASKESLGLEHYAMGELPKRDPVVPGKTIFV